MNCYSKLLRYVYKIPNAFVGRISQAELLCVSTNEPLWKKNFKYGKHSFFYNFWKRSNLLPFWSTISTSLPLVWNELWCRFRNTWLQAWLISLVYLCKFNLVVHTECWKGAFFMDYKAKIYRARWFKPEVTGSWIYVTIVSLSILWSAAQVHCKKKGFSGF